MRQSGGRINNPHGGREHGKEKIIKGYVLDVETVEKTLRAKERDMKITDILYFEMKVSYGVPTEIDAIGCDGMYIESIERIDGKALLRLARAVKQRRELGHISEELHGETLIEEAKALKEVEHLL